MSTSPAAVPETEVSNGINPSPDREKPRVGNPVVVSYFDGNHKVHSVVAHVLAITGAGAGLSTPDGMPAITVAYPDPDAEARVLSSANWQKAYVRRDSVVHFSHPDVNTGKISIAWGHAVDPSMFPDLIAEPAPIVPNPIFTRQDDPVPTQPSMEQAIGVQTGKAPSPTTQTPLLNEEAQMGPAVVDGGEWGDPKPTDDNIPGTTAAEAEDHNAPQTPIE